MKERKGIDMKIVEKERKRNYRLSRTDVFRHRCRYFSDSGIIGSKEFVGEVFDGWLPRMNGGLHLLAGWRACTR